MDDVLREAAEEEAGEGLENERIRFFLKHQSLILEWQSLANQAWDQVALTLKDLAAELSDGRAREAGFEVGPRVVGEEVRGPVLFRPEWCLGEVDEPRVAFVLGWDRRPDPSGAWPSASRPYYGLLTARSTPEGQRLRKSLEPLVAERLKSSDPAFEGFQAGREWSVFRRLERSATWWQSIPVWRENLANEFLKAAIAWEPVATRAVRAFSEGA